MSSTAYTTIPLSSQLPVTDQTPSGLPVTDQTSGLLLQPATNPTAAVPLGVTYGTATYPLMVTLDAARAVMAPEVTPPNGLNQVPAYPMWVSTCMEVVWHGEFDRRFQVFQDLWRLTPTSSCLVGDQYHLFQDSAKVRFVCQNCGRAWTSMKGRVSFWFHLDRSLHEGEVLFKLYGQQCQRCPDTDFSHAMWYPEEVVKVIENLSYRVGSVYYGYVLPPVRVDRRTGKPRAKHDSSLCQACKDGVCKEGWLVMM